MAEETVQDTRLATREETQPLATREAERFLRPAVDIHETDEGLTLVADLPGVDASGLEIQVEDGVLTLIGKPTAARDVPPTYTEFALATYYRQFQLNEAIDQEKISAELKHGTLTLTLPKAERARPRRIDVKVGS